MKSSIRLVIPIVLVLAGAVVAHAAERYVARNGQTPVSGYTSWANAASNIQDAVTAAGVDDTIWISNGVYRGTASPIVNVTKGMKLRGFSGNPRDVVVDGQRTSGVRRRGIYATLSTAGAYFSVENLTVSNCIVWGAGAGVYLVHNAILAGTALVHNCIIVDNMTSNANMHGAGINTFGAAGSEFKTIVSDTDILRNRCNFGTGQGGGLFVSGAAFLMENCRVEGNTTDTADTSGGMRLATGNAIIRDSIFRFNTNVSGAWAGCTEVAGGNLFENCVIQSNRASSAGAILNRSTSTARGPAVFRNCLISNNRAVSNNGGGFYLWSSTNVMENCTVYNNGSQDILLRQNVAIPELRAANLLTEAVSRSGTTVVTATNSRANVITGWLGVNNFTDNPQFVDEAAMDYRLLKTSPCLNTGTNLAWMAGFKDLDGYPRIDPGPGIVDRGCYEYPYRGTVVTVQ